MSDQKLVVVAADDALGFDGEVSAQFGRCPFFLLAEASGTTATVSRVVPNPYRGANQVGPLPRFIREMGADVIIAGAGIIGCAIAYELSRRGVSCLVLDSRRVDGEMHIDGEYRCVILTVVDGEIEVEGDVSGPAKVGQTILLPACIGTTRIASPSGPATVLAAYLP